MAINKWDLVDAKWKEKAAKYMLKQVEDHVGMHTAKTLTFICAKDGMRVENILKAVHKTYLCWNTRISTGMLNIWLRKFKKVQKLPTARDKKLKILFLVQVKTRPPTFSVFINDMDMTDENYVRFMKSHLSEEFGLVGTPIRFVFRGTKYKHLKKKFEKILHGSRGDVRRMFLKRRKLKTFAKIKLDELNSKRGK